MNSVRFKKDSLKFKKEASLCELSARIAEFLESFVPANFYDFALPDLLWFSDEKALLELRENAVWQVLESEFTAAGGIVGEDWEDEAGEAENSKPVKVLRRVPRWKSRAIGLTLIFIVPAIIGGTLGWFFPYQSLPQCNGKTAIN
jgi:hypothetical protein